MFIFFTGQRFLAITQNTLVIVNRNRIAIDLLRRSPTVYISDIRLPSPEGQLCIFWAHLYVPTKYLPIVNNHSFITSFPVFFSLGVIYFLKILPSSSSSFHTLWKSRTVWDKKAIALY